MTPSRVAASLRQIADKIDRSQKPSRVRVSAALRRVLAAMSDAYVAVSGPWGWQAFKVPGGGTPEMAAAVEAADEKIHGGGTRGSMGLYDDMEGVWDQVGWDLEEGETPPATWEDLVGMAADVEGDVRVVPPEVMMKSLQAALSSGNFVVPS